MTKGSQSVVYQAFLGSIGIVEEGRGQATVVGFVNPYGILRRRVTDVTGGDVRQILVPDGLLKL